MQLHKTRIALGLGVLCLGVSGTSNADSQSFNISATTIDDVILTQENGIDFGQTIFTTAGTCLLTGNVPLDTLLQIKPDSAINAVNGNGVLSGTACVDSVAGTGTAGTYKVSGVSGTLVNIAVSSVTETDFSFVPNSTAYGNYDQATDGDTILNLLQVGALYTASTNLADGTDGGDAGVTEAELIFTVGGTLTVINPLIASTPYDSTFDVTVTY
jgi:hypothetical protein